MNRHIWQRYFFEHQRLKWPCPACGSIRLILKKDTLSKGETAESIRNQKTEPNWEPGWIEGRFSCLLLCEECSESVAVAGRYSIEEWGNEELEKIEYEERFVPQFFMNAPHIINLPQNLPLDIQKELENSFQLYWVDLASSANRIRSSVEMLLSHQGIPRFSMNRGKRNLLTLHARIEKFERLNKSLVDYLFAVKWIGNAGSHLTLLDDSDVLDGYELLEHVLSELFEAKSKRIENIARQINRSKKPRSSKGGAK